MSLRGALKGSCNPAFMQLVARIGKETFYKYMEAFGLFDKTGVRLAGEEEGIKHNIENVGPVELAIMSFGQRFTITPLQMINAASTIANGGILYEPQIISKIENPKTNSSEVQEAKVIRKVISEKTSKEMMDLLYSSCGGYVEMSGYKIAGKSGTSEPQPGKEYEGQIASYCAIAPSDDPQIAILVVQKNPKISGFVSGGAVSGTVVKKMLKEIFPLIGVTKEGKKAVVIQKNLSKLPDVTNKTVNEARTLLQQKGFNVIVKNIINPNEALVIEQIPESNFNLSRGSKVYLYTKENENKVTVIVPNIINKNVTNSIDVLKKYNLNYIIEGTKGSVVLQEPESGSIVEEGTVVKIKIE